ncbi:MAG: helix-turn-helix domain-containing protein [Bulleidia sp.]
MKKKITFVQDAAISSEISYEQVQFPISDALRIVEVQVHREQAFKEIPKHWHRSIEILVPIYGSTETWMDGRVYVVHPDEFLIVNSRSIHSCRTVEPQNGYYGYAVQIRYDFLKSCHPDVEYGEFEILYRGEHQKQIHTCLSEMIEMYKSAEPLTHLALQGKLYELVRLLFVYTLHEKSASEASVSGRNRDRLSEIINYLDDHYDSVPDAKTVAEHFHLSYGYFAAMLKNGIHMTMSEYVNSVRLRRIEEDILTTDCTITELCMKHGFANVKSFYREFEKKHHMTPKEYRNSTRSEKKTKNT